MERSPKPDQGAHSLDAIVGLAVKMHRSLLDLTLAELSVKAGVSAAMISKIERGQVSASLATLEALAAGIGVPLVSFFAQTIGRTDVSFVPDGEGITVQRLGDGFGHIYKMIGRAKTNHLGLESYLVTLERPLPKRPLYQHQGTEFIHVMRGKMVYRCGETTFEMGPGDSLSYDSSSPHGSVELLTDSVTFISVACQNEITGS
jgi:transcriptional regulator with XRE-family HTH domain